MKVKSRITRTLVLGSLFAVLFVLIISFSVSRRENSGVKGVLVNDCRTSYDKLDNVKFLDCWRGVIARVGPEASAKDFVKWNHHFSVGGQHTQAHAFGGLLFSMLGKDGLRFCTPDFAFGCYHEFLGKAIGGLGFEVTPELNESCFRYNTNSALSCQHGIGHGLVALGGYEEVSLKKSLDMCRGLPHGDPIGGCNGGIFMEYFLRTMISTDGAPVREMREGKFDECASLDEVYKVACYYWQPQWWFSVVNTSIASHAEPKHTKVFGPLDPERSVVDGIQMGKWCSLIPSEFQEKCYRGIGNYTGVRVGYDPSRAIEFCKNVSRGQNKAFTWCIEDAANSFAVIPEYSKIAQKVCAPLKVGDDSKCLSGVRDLGVGSPE
jgi:hypothetical protein